jgi:hypothetical protein
MKKLFYFLCVICMCVSLTSCGDLFTSKAKDEDAVTHGKVVISERPATKDEIACLIEDGQHLDIKYGKRFETNYGTFQYVYFNGHRHIMWQLSPVLNDASAAIFEDGECPKCKKQREEFKRELLEEIKYIHRHL